MKLTTIRRNSESTISPKNFILQDLSLIFPSYKYRTHKMNVNERLYWNNTWFLCVCLWKAIVLLGKCFFPGPGTVLIKPEHTTDPVNHVEGHVAVSRILHWTYNHKNKIPSNCHAKSSEKYSNQLKSKSFCLLIFSEKSVFQELLHKSKARCPVSNRTQ